MSSVLRPVRKRKKVRTLGPVDIIRCFRNQLLVSCR